MTLSSRTFEIILDLLENKISCMEGWDQTTSRERAKLEACRRELVGLQKKERAAAPQLGEGAVNVEATVPISSLRPV